MVDVWDERDDKLDLGQLGVKGSRVVDIERDGGCVLDALAELLGARESTAGYDCTLVAVPDAVFFLDVSEALTNSELDTGLGQLVDSRLGDYRSSNILAN